MDETDRKLLSLLQAGVPITARPWTTLGEKVGLTANEVIERIKALKNGKVIRQISAIFDTRSLGYRSSLVAVQCDPERVDATAAIISEHPGVSHNYQRNHAYNLWYTLAVAPNSRLGLERTVKILHERSGAKTSRLLPTLHLFKIGVELDVEGSGRVDARGEIRYSQRNQTPEEPLTEQEMRFIREMQRDLPIEPEPFVAIARRVGVTLEQLQLMSEAMLTVGKMRRFSAVLNHRQAGFNANGMGVWAVPGTEAEIMAIGEKMAAFKAVSHCYRRPTYEDWPYNIFTMIHARSREDCEALIARMAKETGITEHDILYSTKEYKKTRVTYFTEAEQTWEAHCGA